MAARRVRKVPPPSRLAEDGENFGTLPLSGTTPAEPTGGLGPPNVMWPEAGSGFEPIASTPAGVSTSFWNALQWASRSRRRRHSTRVALYLFVVVIAAVALFGALLQVVH